MRPTFPEKAISSSAVARPPSLTSWPALIFRARSSSCVASHAPASAAGTTSGTSSPICAQQCRNEHTVVFLLFVFLSLSFLFLLNECGIDFLFLK